MGILSSLFERRNVSLTDTERWRELGWLRTNAAGVSVSEESSLRYSAVFACVRVLAETVASLPLLTYRRMGAGKARAPEFYLYPLLHDKPNPFMTSFEWRETMQGHLALWGNAYSSVTLDGRGRLAELWPLRPDRMEKIELKGGQLLYHYRLPNGKLERMPGWSVFHLRGLSADGLFGYSPIGMARQAVGLGLAAEEFGARFFGNDARPGGVLQHPGVLGDEAYNRLQESWESRHGGLSKSHKIAILEEGMRYEQIGIPPEDAQFLETRKFQRSEIASIFRVPPHMIGDLERATFSNIEHQSLEFVTHTIRPWLVRWEQAIQQRLMSTLEQTDYFVEFLVDGLLRGDIASRYQAYSVGRQNGWLSADDIRELENMNPLPDDQGSMYLVPLNMVPADQVGTLPSLPAARSQEPPETAVSDIKEQRAVRSATRRNQLQRAHIGVYTDVAARVLRREINDVGAAARRFLGQRDLFQFRQWLNEFYQAHQAFVVENFAPVTRGYAQLVADEVGREVAPPDDDEAVPRFVNSYLGSYAVRHVAMSQAAVETAVQGDDPQAALDELWDRWREVRPGTIATDETVRANNAVSKMLYAAAGVTVLRWFSIGDTCPYCTRLHGQVVGIDSWFIQAGETFAADAPDGPLTPSRNVGHPPAHRGCDCMVVAG